MFKWNFSKQILKKGHNFTVSALSFDHFHGKHNNDRISLSSHYHYNKQAKTIKIIC